MGELSDPVSVSAFTLLGHALTCKPDAQLHIDLRWVGRKTSKVIQVRHTFAHQQMKSGTMQGGQNRTSHPGPDMQSSWKHLLLTVLAKASLWQTEDYPQLPSQ